MYKVSIPSILLFFVANALRCQSCCCIHLTRHLWARWNMVSKLYMWVISGAFFTEGIRHPNLQGMWERAKYWMKPLLQSLFLWMPIGNEDLDCQGCSTWCWHILEKNVFLVTPVQIVFSKTAKRLLNLLQVYCRSSMEETVFKQNVLKYVQCMATFTKICTWHMSGLKRPGYHFQVFQGFLLGMREGGHM